MSTEESRPSVSPDRLAELEEERRFLLRSIGDLERERAAGDVEAGDYHALRDGYTARAAAVLRAIDEGRTGLPPKQPRNWKRLIAVTLAAILVGVGAGILVARASGQRDPGDTITGGTSPDQVAALLSEGRSLLSASDFGEASKRFLAVLDIQPDNVEANTYAGWVLAVSSQAQTDPAVVANLLDQSGRFLDHAIELDSTYADPHCFKAIIAVVFKNDLIAAASNRTACVADNPSGDMVGLIETIVDPALGITTGTAETSVAQGTGTPGSDGAATPTS
ncbi:MAG: hypothetical protein JWN62_4036 [Acidimicrobiales bacterium]|nr:hypothetical protein [Acidimicrobiales bacterium]